MEDFEQVQQRLLASPKVWLITGCAGFIGSNLLEALLRLNQTVVGLDNFSTGFLDNLTEVRKAVTAKQWGRFRFLRGDIRNLDDCRKAVDGVEVVLHQAALGSVPRSLAHPIMTNDVNVGGFLNMLVAARDAQAGSFVYAASSSTYGDHPGLPKVEHVIGRPLSPYAVTKLVNEVYADVFSRCYGFKSIGLRYFNVFGRRQNPNGAYAAVIPRWIAAMIKGEEVCINGDGETSRDFCYIDNAVKANILAAVARDENRDEIYNIAVNDNISLKELFLCLREALRQHGIDYRRDPVWKDFRAGDVRHSQANIDKARQRLAYVPTFRVRDGIRAAAPWYIQHERGLPEPVQRQPEANLL